MAKGGFTGTQWPIPDDWTGQPLIIVFFIALEHPIAIPEGEHLFVTHRDVAVPWITWNGGYSFVAFRIWRTKEQETVLSQKDANAFEIARRLTGTPTADSMDGSPYGRVPEPLITSRGTVVEVATPLLLADGADANTAISSAFNRCLNELALLMQAYLGVTHDLRFRPITRQTCRTVIPMTTQDLSGNYGGLGVFNANQGLYSIPFEASELTEEQINAVQVSRLRLQRGDPFAGYVERARVAHRDYVVEGDYPTTVVAAYTACEVLLNSTLLTMAWEEGLDREETRVWFEGQMGFMARVGTYVVPRLGGNWSTQRSENPMSQLARLSDSRNRVVHLGHLPNEAEAQAAINALSSMDEFIKERLADKMMIYPRTTLLILGEPGLRRLGKWTRRMRQWVEHHANQEEEWIGSFRAWRDSPVSPTS
jgi:hypothetical protein